MLPETKTIWSNAFNRLWLVRSKFFLKKNEIHPFKLIPVIEGDVLDDTAISEELLDDNDDVLNVSNSTRN